MFAAEAITIDSGVFAVLAGVLATGMITYVAWLTRELTRATRNNAVASERLDDLARTVTELNREIERIRDVVFTTAWTGARRDA